MYTTINTQHLNYFTSVCSAHNVSTDHESLLAHSHDETEALSYLPQAVVAPEDKYQAAAVIKYCNQHTIPVTVRGGGTGLSGAALPVQGGVCISTRHFNKILNVDTENLQATVQPGVITEVFINHVAAYDLLYPVDPASKGSCFIGGNVSMCSGGPRVVKYGTIREYILNLEVVLATGEIINTSANTIKYASGYNLTQLFIGSEGTLGFITEITVKLIPKPSADVLMLVSFATNAQACAAVAKLFMAKLNPSAVEYMERTGFEWVMQYDNIQFTLHPDAQAFLLVEFDGNNLDELYNYCETANNIFEEGKSLEVLFADTATQKEELWHIRRAMAESVKMHSVYKEEDTVVPRAYLPQLIDKVKELGNTFGFKSVCYGHAGDGNLHINILKAGLTDEEWNVGLTDAITQLFEYTLALGGAISGEHGIGLVQKKYMPLAFPPHQLALMQGIKNVFDPNGIFNPGKILP